MNVLAVGDIVGSTGIEELKKRLPIIKKEYKINFCIVNGENAAEGMGLTRKNFEDILRVGCRLRYYGKPYVGEKRNFYFYRSFKIN